MVPERPSEEPQGDPSGPPYEVRIDVRFTPSEGQDSGSLYEAIEAIPEVDRVRFVDFTALAEVELENLSHLEKLQNEVVFLQDHLDQAQGWLEASRTQNTTLETEIDLMRAGFALIGKILAEPSTIRAFKTGTWGLVMGILADINAIVAEHR